MYVKVQHFWNANDSENPFWYQISLKMVTKKITSLVKNTLTGYKCQFWVKMLKFARNHVKTILYFHFRPFVNFDQKVQNKSLSLFFLFFFKDMLTLNMTSSILIFKHVSDLQKKRVKITKNSKYCVINRSM